MRLSVLLTAALLLVSAAACGSNVRVTGVVLGRGINMDQTVSGHTTVFKPDETIYVSVQTAGRPIDPM
ncbi:hypothetical protein BH23ACI1_BH23ACI1_30670 [soil metagenome]